MTTREVTKYADIKEIKRIMKATLEESVDINKYLLVFNQGTKQVSKDVTTLLQKPVVNYFVSQCKELRDYVDSVSRINKIKIDDLEDVSFMLYGSGINNLILQSKKLEILTRNYTVVKDQTYLLTRSIKDLIIHFNQLEDIDSSITKEEITSLVSELHRFRETLSLLLISFRREELKCNIVDYLNFCNDKEYNQDIYSEKWGSLFSEHIIFFLYTRSKSYEETAQ